MARIRHPEFVHVDITPLYHDAYEDVSVLYFSPGSEMRINSDGGAEILVLDGSVTDQSDTLTKYDWLRTPVNSQAHVTAGPEGARVWLKTGHLTDTKNQISRLHNA